MLLFISNVKSQSFYDVYTKIELDSNFKQQKSQVDSLLILCERSNLHVQFSNIAGDFAKNHWVTNINSAINYTSKAIEAIDTFESEKPFLATLYFRRGFFNYRANNIKKAILDYKKVIALDIAPARSAQSYCGIGEIYLQRGDYYEAINFYENGVRLLEEENDYKKLANQYVNLAIAYENIGDLESLEKKLEILHKSEALQDKIVFSPLQERNLYNSYAILYSKPKLFNFEKAKEYHNKNIQILSNNSVVGGLCDTYINLADIHNYVESDSAIHYVKQSLNICEDSIKIAKSYDQRSTFFLHNKKYSEAVNSIQQTLQWIGYEENDPNVIPTINSLHTLSNKSYLVDVFQRKATILFKLGIDTDSSHSLKLALENIKVSDELLKIIQGEDFDEQSRFYWQETASSIYSLGMAISAALKDKEVAFYFMQRNKAVLLTSGILANVRKETFPEEITIRERKLRKEIFALLAEIERSEINKVASERRLFDKREKLKIFQDSVKRIYPNYNTFNKVPNVITLEEAQNMLSSSTAMVSYFWGDENHSEQKLYALLLTNTVAEFVVLDSGSAIAQHIKDFQKGISKPFSTVDDKTSFLNTSHTLFNLLFPFKRQLRDEIEKLIVVPDGLLQNIPFEAFIVDLNSQEYLIRSKDISYAYSMSFLNYNNTIKRMHTRNFVGFAPIHYNKPEHYDLPNTQKELEAIEALIPGTSFMREKATKANFLNQSGNSKIIHLATHADASANPGIVFHDEKLKLHELYTFQNRAELVVLSACNTSIGEDTKGEGILSLTRGFFYSGANTVVSNAWTLNDKSASFIMKHFYTNIYSGQTKSKALQEAKLAYMDAHSLSEKSPFYWASLLLIGDDGNLSLKASFKYDYYLVLIPICLLFLFLYWKRRLRSV